MEGCKNQASFVLPVVINLNPSLMPSKLITIEQYKPLSHGLVQKFVTVPQRPPMCQYHRTILRLHSEIVIMSETAKSRCSKQIVTEELKVGEIVISESRASKSASSEQIS